MGISTYIGRMDEELQPSNHDVQEEAHRAPRRPPHPPSFGGCRRSPRREARPVEHHRGARLAGDGGLAQRGGPHLPGVELPASRLLIPLARRFCYISADHRGAGTPRRARTPLSRLTTRETVWCETWAR